MHAIQAVISLTFNLQSCFGIGASSDAQPFAYVLPRIFFLHRFDYQCPIVGYRHSAVILLREH